MKRRLNGEFAEGMSFTEFTYQLLQGYDFLHLYETKGCRLQMGGSDQWGNITTGSELIRRKLGGENEAFALTCPLITKADGKKFGKTEQGNVWLDRHRTTPYAFYQFWLNVGDEEAERYIKIFTGLPKEEIDTLIEEHRQDPRPSRAAKTLGPRGHCARTRRIGLRNGGGSHQHSLRKSPRKKASSSSTKKPCSLSSTAYRSLR